MILENEKFYFFRKPVGVASTRGDGVCFLDQIKNGSYTPISQRQLQDMSLLDMYTYFMSFYKQIGLIDSPDPYSVVSRLSQSFSPEQEYGLVNRLDSDTSGLLYFAKDQETYGSYHQLQVDEKVLKHYVAKVSGNVGRIIQNGTAGNHNIDLVDDTIEIHYPMMHHRHLDDRMVVIREEQDTEKGRGKMLTPTTHCRVISYDVENNQSLVHLSIRKGVRHQIRCHLAGLGYPILGELLYANKEQELHKLRLWSIGMEIKS